MTKLQKAFAPKVDRNFYIERGVRVKKGSALDKAIEQFKKHGYYTIDSGGELNAKTKGFAILKYHHPLVPERGFLE